MYKEKIEKSQKTLFEVLFQLKEEAEDEAKAMDLNKVVLRFQTFFFDNKSNYYRPITDYVDSDVIFNLSKLYCKILFNKSVAF